MNKKQIGMALVVVAGAFSAQAAGFALYGGSAKGMGMGGAVLGRGLDASANFYNPATISDFENTVITLGSGIEVPRADIKANMPAGEPSKTHLDPGSFLLPHGYVVQPLGAGFTFGLGMAAEYGLGSKYGSDWGMNWNTTQTTIEGFVVNPNLAYAVTEDWSVAAGFRIIYLTFDQKLNPYARQYLPMSGLGDSQLDSHIKADNNFADWGWQLSSRYRILDNLSAGIMYRSYIDARLRGKCTTTRGSVPGPYGDMIAAAGSGTGGGDIRLPQSVTAGLNWGPIETVHLGASVTYTGWSSMEKLVINLPSGPNLTKLEWRNVYRLAFGAAWDFAEDWTLMGSYCFDMDPCSTKMNEGSTMLPSGDRHAVTMGLAYRWHSWEISGTYGIILMHSESQEFTDFAGRQYKFGAHAAYSHQAGVTLSYYF